jgi:integrase
MRLPILKAIAGLSMSAIPRVSRDTIQAANCALPLDAAGTPIAVQQKLMRHSDIRTTLNVYGDVVTDEMAQANSKVASMALSQAN